MFITLPWMNLELLGRIGVVENFWEILKSYSNSNSDLQLLGFSPPSLIQESGCVRLIISLWSLLQSCRYFFSLQLSYEIHLLIPSGLRVMADLPWLVRWFLSSGFFLDIWRSNRWIFVIFIPFWNLACWLQLCILPHHGILSGLGVMIFQRSDCVGTWVSPAGGS